MVTKARAFQEACRLRRHDQRQQACSHLSSLARPRKPLITSRRRICSASAQNPPRLEIAFQTPLSQRIRSRSASTASGPSRRAVTVTTDDGRYNWNELSRGEKAARGTQQTFNFLLVSLGLVGTVSEPQATHTRLKSADSSSRSQSLTSYTSNSSPHPPPPSNSTPQSPA